MKPLLLVLTWGSLVLSCTALPTIQQTELPAADAASPVCQGFYPSGDWQLLHTIEAELPGRHTGFLMGLTRLSSRERSARCVVMTMEGFVVFDAHLDGKIKVERAVAPFDNEAFAHGMMEDIRLIFFKPLSEETTAGTLADGAPVCRHHLAGGVVIDMLHKKDGAWETRRFSADHRLNRIVESIPAESLPKKSTRGIADQIELNALGPSGYKLVLDLVEAIPLEPE